MSEPGCSGQGGVGNSQCGARAEWEIVSVVWCGGVGWPGWSGLATQMEQVERWGVVGWATQVQQSVYQGVEWSGGLGWATQVQQH